MIIAIGGLTGSGKTTLGKLLARELGYRLIAPTFKDLAKKEGLSLEEFQKKAEKDYDIDKKFDEYIREESKKGNCIVATWLSAWNSSADLKILLYAPLEVRAKRIKERDNIKNPEEYIKRIDENNHRRYLKVYGINIYDKEVYDICFNTSTFSPEEMVKIIKKIINIKGDNNASN